MTPDYDIELIKILWKLGGNSHFTTSEGTPVIVRKHGEHNEANDRFTNTEVEINGKSYCGEIIIWQGQSPPAGNFESVVLHVVPSPSAHIMRVDGSLVPQVIFDCDGKCREAYRNLRDGAFEHRCGALLGGMEKHEYVGLYTRLIAERIQRKTLEVKAIYEQSQYNWNETMYIMLMRVMGSSKNKEAFQELAGKVKYSMLSRERNTREYVEAMLIGASGLLEVYPDDDYIRQLKSNFDYLRRKYNIIPMYASKWTIDRVMPHAQPIMRMAQLAAFLSNEDFLFDRMLNCLTADKIRAFFTAEASEYWTTHYLPGKVSPRRPKKIGPAKSEMIGINLTVPMLFAYGDYTNNEKVKEQAIDLLEKINREGNSIVDGWKAEGAPAESAFDSQALLQLNNEYCRKGLCWKCRIGRQAIRRLQRKQSAQKM